MTSYQFITIRPEGPLGSRYNGLFDELLKMAAEEKEKSKSLAPAMKAIGTAALGTSLGLGASELIAKRMKFFQPPTNPGQMNKRLLAARIILPVLAGTSVVLADRYRKKMNEQYSKVRGFQGEKHYGKGPLNAQ